MELKIYLQIILKKWWIVVPTLLITITTGVVMTFSQIPQYSTSAIYVVVPSSSFSNVRNFADGLDILGRREEIATTFAEIASSRTIKNLAIENQALSPEVASEYKVGSTLREGTNIIEITVDGPDPTYARDLANGVGDAVVEYVQGMYEVFRLSPLDEATRPKKPISPNIPFNIALVSVLGLVLGIGVAFLSEYLDMPLQTASVNLSIIDETTGMYNKNYLLQRLGEEMIRSKRNRYPLSLALLRFSNLELLKGGNSSKARHDLLHQAAMVINQSLREEDIVAPFQEDTFAVLLPDMTGENAQATMEYLQTLIAWTPFQLPDNKRFNLKGTVGIVTYGHNGTSRDQLVAKATEALQLAEVSHDGKAYLISELHPATEQYAQ